MSKMLNFRHSHLENSANPLTLGGCLRQRVPLEKIGQLLLITPCVWGNWVDLLSGDGTIGRVSPSPNKMQGHNTDPKQSRAICPII